MPSTHLQVDRSRVRAAWPAGQPVRRPAQRSTAGGWRHVRVSACKRSGVRISGLPGLRRGVSVDPEDEAVTDGEWLYDLMDERQHLPGWSGRRPCTDQDREAVLEEPRTCSERAPRRDPERTILSSAAVVTGPALPHRIWRSPTHALGPTSDNGSIASSPHAAFVQASLLQSRPAARDGEVGLGNWISAHVDWMAYPWASRPGRGLSRRLQGVSRPNEQSRGTSRRTTGRPRSGRSDRRRPPRGVAALLQPPVTARLVLRKRRSPRSQGTSTCASMH
jgi:hypothetical protein